MATRGIGDSAVPISGAAKNAIPATELAANSTNNKAAKEFSGLQKIALVHELMTELAVPVRFADRRAALAPRLL
jgi:hypothetical protein